MICASCGHENPEDSTFCGECAATVARDQACPSCGRVNPAAQKFCNGCAHPLAAEPAMPGRDPRAYTPKHLADKILRSKSALEGERKQVTVLFADVKGSTAIAERLDPEQWHAISDRFIQVLFDGVHRFEGTVNQVTGDGVMALFGAPIAHEDHAQRACYSALHLGDALKRCSDEVRRSHGVTLAFRMGINSGEVVVGKIGNDLRMDYTAAGLTTNLADRVQKLCDPGSVNLSEYTARLVDGYFQLRDLGQFELPGISGNVGIRELEGVGALRTRLDRSRARGFSRFVGRAREMDTLNAALEYALDKNGQVVGVVGEAGVGKSRLCDEFVEACRAKGIAVYDAHCPAHGRNVPYLPLLEMFRKVFGIGDRDSDHEARRKIAGELALLGGEFEEVLPLVFDLLGVTDPERPPPDLSADARKKRLFAFQRRLIQARSQREPAVLFVDDVHWIDPGSDEFLAQTVEAVEGTRTLLLLNFRPEYPVEWASRSWYQQLPLVPLGAEAIRELLDDLLGSDPSVDQLKERIAERTRGNPFFTEEVVQSLHESGYLEGERGQHRLARAVDEIEIPASVQPVLSARIDRLPEREKHVLQTASVIGKRFPHAILERVAELPDEELSAALSALEAAEFVHTEVLYPEPEYEFKHPLTQDAALSSQLAEKLRAVNGSVARALIDVYPDRHDEYAALIAQHFEDAGESGDAARWHGRAARWTLSRNPAQAAEHWRKVRELAPVDTERDLALEARIELLKDSWRIGPDDTEQVYSEGVELAGDDKATRAILLAWSGRSLASAGDMDMYLEISKQARDLAEQTDDVSARSDGWCVFTDSLLATGLSAEALEAAEAGLALFDDRNAPKIAGTLPARSWWRCARAIALMGLGRMQEARDDLDQGFQLALDEESPDGGWVISVFQTYLAELVGDPQNARRWARRVAEYCEAAGEPPTYRLAVILEAGLAALADQDWSEAADAARRAIQEREECHLELTETPFGWGLLAEALVGARDWQAAHETATRAMAEAQKYRRYWWQVRSRIARAQSHAHCNDPSDSTADSFLDEADALIRESSLHCYTPRVLEARAELAGLRGDREAAETRLREAHQLYGDMGATGHAERVARELEQLS